MDLLDKGTSRTSTEIFGGILMMRANLQPLDYKLSALAIELYSPKAIAGKELSLSSWCIASLYFIISQL